MAQLHLFWDESHIWGLLAVRAVRAFGLPHRLVTAEDIRAGILQQEKPAMLLVPGGGGRFKSQSLGAVGIQAIREYVLQGGKYLGFCGGAGLALAWGDKDSGGLGICPWKRGGFNERMQHFMSGHLYVDIPKNNSGLLPSSLYKKECYHDFTAETMADNSATDERVTTNIPFAKAKPLLPVWWPGRFAQEDDPSISILATYSSPGPDFWLTDLAIASLPPHIFKVWNDLYGFTISPTFLENQPCVIAGEYGKGKYVLSYSHLETPASPDANSWLSHLFSALGGLSPTGSSVPSWDSKKEHVLWEDLDLAEVEANISRVAQVGLEHNMLFLRNEWLLGWRTGIPGSNLNNLLSLVREARRYSPNNNAFSRWAGMKKQVLAASRLFAQAGAEYLLTERLAMTLSKTLPETLPVDLLRDRRAALFGPPMQAGGVYLELLNCLDELAYLQLTSSVV